MSTQDTNKSIHITIENENDLRTICGSNNENLAHLESLMGGAIFLVGNELRYMSPESRSIEDFRHVCELLQQAIRQKHDVNRDTISTIYKQLTGIPAKERKAEQSLPSISSITIPITEKKIVARTDGQREIIKSLKDNLLTFLVGPAGTGKTYFATAYALEQLLSKKKERYIITRPVVEAGEKLGFLPGDLEQKILPYLRPIYDALYELAGENLISLLQEKKQIEIAPLAYMRGRTLKNAVVLLDEAQNCSPAQMRMFLTRLGEGSVAIVNGDLSQSDIPMRNGLEEAVQIFLNTKNVNVVKLSNRDLQRSKLAKIVVEAYEKKNREYQDRFEDGDRRSYNDPRSKNM